MADSFRHWNQRAVSTGAGAQTRIAIGAAVVDSMVTGNVLAIIAVPTFIALIRRLLT